MGVSVVLGQVRGVSEAQRRIIERAVARLAEALADPGFLPAVARADYVETRWTPLHGQWRSLTGDEIAARIAAGLERGTDPGDAVLDLSFELIELPGPASGRPVLGSTALGCQPIHPATWFVERCAQAGDAVNLASHFMHEWMHLSGFYHWPDNKARGDAPYVVGRLVRETLAPMHQSEIDPTITELSCTTSRLTAAAVAIPKAVSALDARRICLIEKKAGPPMFRYSAATPAFGHSRYRTADAN